MNFIIFDLEWNPIFYNKKLVRQEITEIGAIEVSNVDGLLIIGRKFHSYVRPMNPIKKRIKRLTNVKEPDTWLAPKFSAVIARFKRWLGQNEYIFCSWGEDDRTVFLNNLLFHELHVSYQFNEYINLQSAFSLSIGKNVSEQIGLLKALEMLNLTFEGYHHRSVDDAMNTAKIFMHVYRRIEMNPEPFVNDLSKDRDYRKGVYRFKQLRENLQISYRQLSEMISLDQEDIEKIENFQLVTSKKEMTRLVHLLYSIKSETMQK